MKEKIELAIKMKIDVYNDSINIERNRNENETSIPILVTQGKVYLKFVSFSISSKKGHITIIPWKTIKI
jgi:hypothetical protein